MFPNTVEVHIPFYFSARFNSSAREYVKCSLIFGVIIKYISKMYVTFSLLIPSILTVDQLCLSDTPGIFILILFISLFTQSGISSHYVPISVTFNCGLFPSKCHQR